MEILELKYNQQENKHMDTKGGKWRGWWWWCDELGDWD